MTVPVDHSATSAACPTVAPSCPVTIATPLTAACSSSSATGVGTPSQALPPWP